ncbi:MAG TPA: RdgB/HAM1 family non-canonical purine NTP pyrophosphatase [Candidatus Acidoferrum sp.]|nr:RdgB/HAM1 family non-canonical purine NTP pyrophosphatase [Candidatus Acidoferrum sp.]
MTDIVLASGNKKKLIELQELLMVKNVNLLPQSQFRIADVEENGLSFVENAILKARHASKMTGLPAIADDSGIEVDALKGAPGIYSARFAHRYFSGGFKQLPPLHSDLQWQSDDVDAANNALLLELLAGVPDGKRGARFQCAIAMFRFADDPMPLICQGAWEGSIVREPHGTHGFGYDPLFWLEDYGCTSAALAPQVKNSLSHRAQALQQLLARWPL